MSLLNCKHHGLPLTHVQILGARAFRVCLSCSNSDPVRPSFDTQVQSLLLKDIQINLDFVLAGLKKSKVLTCRKYFIDQLQQFRHYSSRWLQSLLMLDQPALDFIEAELTKGDSWQPEVRISEQISKLAYLNKKKGQKIQALSSEIKLKDKVISDLSRQNEKKTGFIEKSVRSSQRLVNKSPVRQAKHQQIFNGEYDEHKELQIRLKNGLQAEDYRLFLRGLTRYRNLKILHLYLRDYKLSNEIGEIFREELSALKKLQFLLIQNHFETCEGTQFQRIRGFKKAVENVKNGRLVGSAW